MEIILRAIPSGLALYASARRLLRPFMFQGEFVRRIRVGEPFDPDLRYSRFQHAKRSCRRAGNVDDTALLERSPVVDPYFD